jgi:hypothetical protein
MDGTNHGESCKECNVKACKCQHHKLVPLSLMVVGFVLLLESLGIFNINVGNVIIGLFIVVIGGSMLGSRTCGCCDKS